MSKRCEYCGGEEIWDKNYVCIDGRMGMSRCLKCHRVGGMRWWFPTAVLISLVVVSAVYTVAMFWAVFAKSN